MKISNQSTSVPDEVDIIVAGGGAAGCTLAARLAKAAPSLSILIIEAGINNRDVPQVIYPALFLSNLAPDSKTATFHVGKANEHMNGREPIVPVGGCLGGGSSINFMMYTRAQGIDYDGWNMEGWCQKDLLPLLKKTETYHNDDPRIDKSLHGYQGDFHVSRSGFVSEKMQQDWFDSAAKIGMKEVADANDLKEADGIHRWLRWVNPNTGRRSDSAHVMVHPLLDAGTTGLQVLTEHKVVKVLTENGRAVGVEYFPNQGAPVGIPAAEAAVSPKIVKARKLVVVSAGALGSPCILERSGIGSKPALSSLGIPVVANVPGVGENYQDHNLFMNVYTTTAEPSESFDPFLDGRRSFDDEIAALSSSDPGRPKYVSWNGIDTAAKVRPNAEELERAPEAFKALWNKDYAPYPERPLMVMVMGSAHVGDHSLLPEAQYMSTACFTSYPYSRGHVHITGKNVNDKLDFETGMLNNAFDVEALVMGYKRQREIVRRMKCFAGAEGIIAGPKFPENGKAIRWDWPTDNGACTPYSDEDNAAIEDFVRNATGTTWHSCGTCAMKKEEDGGVVDGRLKVYGVEGLKVADLSIIPANVSGNTYSTALVIGEKAACIIAEDLGIGGF
ncbi:hypothetical protein H072_4285 [Dactylellina haptotyla CBS 200.50]|uniref:Glucose-methanol-choline oxidoreductase N-terminal domain-containing protein n=1 Tax=Dactylellina haptotyla (strain CBS 200.50) TaxID=1284197 RepID=S8AL16_DACHA|nr:hypothetical protein H072_4285 [Dactylellina haptotyla CBS 200.50]